MEGKQEDKLVEDIYNDWRSALSECIGVSPNTLFVFGMGSPKNDIYFYERFPAGFNFPNLISVGAVGEQGNKIDFTAVGSSVDVYANGFEVESIVPNGERKKYSASTVAAPQVSNLAAKILAINPNLTPAQVKDLIIKNSNKSTEGFLLINPKKTIEFIKRM